MRRPGDDVSGAAGCHDGHNERRPIDVRTVVHSEILIRIGGSAGGWHDGFECGITIEFNVDFTVDGGVSDFHHDGRTNFCSATVKTEFDTSILQNLPGHNAPHKENDAATAAAAEQFPDVQLVRRTIWFCQFNTPPRPVLMRGKMFPCDVW